jgi:hypothetical protein
MGKVIVRPRWKPTDDYPAARNYRADAGLTASGSAVRVRGGTLATATGIKALDRTSTMAPPDGMGLFRLSSGRLLKVCGAPSGHADTSVNTVWNSDDGGKTWAVLLVGEAYGAETRFKRGHTQGYIEHNGYAYVIGGDPVADVVTGFPSRGPNGEVWRTPLSGDGTVWTKICDTCPTSTLRIFLYWTLGGNLYIAGGQTDVNNGGSGQNTVYRSTDQGVTWTSLGAAPWLPRGMACAGGPLPVINGKVYLIGGGNYDHLTANPTTPTVTWDSPSGMSVTITAAGTLPLVVANQLFTITDHSVSANNGTYKATGTPTTSSITCTKVSGQGVAPQAASAEAVTFWKDQYFNDVWSFDGTTWTEILPLGHTQFDVVRYHTTIAYGSLLFMFNGSPTPGAEHAKGYVSADLGATWTYLGNQNEHWNWGNTHAACARVVDDRIIIDHGFQSDNLYQIVPHQGALVSQWLDQGSAGKTLSQSTDANKPILDLSRSKPEVVFTFGQMLELAAIDNNINGGSGVFEIYFIGRTINFDTTQGSGSAPPIVVVGNSDVGGSEVSALGFRGGALEYTQYSSGWQPTTSPLSTYNDDAVRLYGVRHQNGQVELFVKDTTVLTDTTLVGFTAGTGWKSIGRGWQAVNYAPIAIRELVILTLASPSASDFRTKMQARAVRLWGAAA